MRRVARTLGLVTSLLLLGTAVFWMLPSVPSFQQVRGSFDSSEAVLYDRNGFILDSLRVDEQGRRLSWVALPDISPRLVETIVAAEDRRFYRHQGVDWWGVLGAASDSILCGRHRGASTITMQLAGLLSPGLQAGASGRSIRQKLEQMLWARLLELQWSKQEILEAYLNRLSFRGELEGIAAASRALFGKDPNGLTQSECLILASLVRAPNAPPERVGERAVQLAEALGWKDLQTEIRDRVRDSLTGNRFIKAREDWAPHVARRLLANGDSDKGVVSTLDREIQVTASEILQKHLARVQDQNVKDGALLVVENQTGNVLAYVGNGAPFTSARYVDGIRAFRQAGSTLKPLLYALALDRQLITPASLLEDFPLDLPVYGGVYRPSNYDNHFRGLVSARTALASSLNIPAVRLLQVVGVDSFTRLLRHLDFQDIREPLYYGPSLALGTADITLWSLVNAFRTLAEGGSWSELHLSPGSRQAETRHIFSREAAFLVSDILSDREARSATFGLDSPLSTPFWSAVKTGTSKDMRDNWCVGFSSRYSVGVWVGNFSSEPMWNVSGVTGAAPVWSEMISYLHRTTTSEPPVAPPGVHRQSVEFSGKRRLEWFIRGTEMKSVEVAPHPARYRIAYPARGTTIALDPDIPSDLQRVFFEANPERDQLSWLLDAESIPSGIWQPQPGRHQLRLLDERGKVLDEIWFQVRGGG